MPMPTRLAEKVVKGAKSICVVRCWSRLLHGSVPPVVRGQEAWLKRPKRIKYSMLMSLFSFINVQLGAWCPVRPGCLCKGEGLFVTEVPLCIFKSNAVIWPYPGYLLRSVAGGGMPLSSTRNMECSCDTRLRSSAEAPGWLALGERRQLFSRTDFAIDVWAKVVEQLTACHLRIGSEAPFSADIGSRSAALLMRRNMYSD